MADIYEVALYDSYGVQQAVLQGWEYLEFTQRLNKPWNHNIRFELSAEDSDDPITTILRSSMDVDWIIRVRRTDPVTNEVAVVYEGFNRTIVDQVKATGAVIFNLYGTGYTELLTRRIVLPPTGYEDSSYAGNAETVLKNFVNDQAVNPADPDRIIPGLSIETTANLGKYVEHTARYTNLLTVVKKIAEDGEIDFGIVGGTVVGTYLLRTAILWGEDKTSTNTYGNDPVIFSTYHGNMSIPIFSRNRSEERNCVYVGGMGEGVNRRILTRSTARIQDSALNRREAFLDARQSRKDADLSMEGDFYLNDKAYLPTLSFNVEQTESCRWLQHWSLGDLVSAIYYDYVFAEKIISVTVRVGAATAAGSSREFVSAELETVPSAWELGISGRTELGETTILG